MGFDGDACRDGHGEDQEMSEDYSREREDALDERVNQALRRWVEGMERAIEEASARRKA